MSDAELLTLQQATVLSGLTRRKVKHLIYLAAVSVAQEDYLGEPLIARGELMRFLQSGRLQSVKFPDRAAQREHAFIARLGGKNR